ncbi:hypothetical protein BH09CHL1_BH09CHL1_34760 [soil metagenome]
MLRRRFEEMVEELKQQMMPTRPEIGIPQPKTIFERAPLPERTPEGMSRPNLESLPEATPRPRTEPPPRPRPFAIPLPTPVRQQSGIRAQLSSPTQRRIAFQLIEVLGPPVSMREPQNRDR